MDAIIDRLVVTVHAEGSTRLAPAEIRAIVAACVSAMKAEDERDARRRADTTATGAYQSQIRGQGGGMR